MVHLILYASRIANASLAMRFLTISSYGMEKMGEMDLRSKCFFLSIFLFLCIGQSHRNRDWCLGVSGTFNGLCVLLRTEVFLFRFFSVSFSFFLFLFCFFFIFSAMVFESCECVHVHLSEFNAM